MKQSIPTLGIDLARTVFRLCGTGRCAWRGRLMRNSRPATISAQCAIQPAARAMANITVVGIETDILFPVGQQAEIVRGLRKAGREVEFARLESIQGHDPFLVDAVRFAPVLRDFLDRT